MEKKTFPLELSPQDHATIKRKAHAAGIPMYKYITHMSVDGKLPKKSK